MKKHGKRGKKGSGKEKRQFNPTISKYIDWLAKPREFLGEDEAVTITDYAIKANVDRRTLYNYSQKPGFWDEVRSRYEKEFAYKNLRVDQALYHKAVGQPCGSVSSQTGTRDGKAVDIKVVTKQQLAPDTNAIELWKTIHDNYVKKLELKQASVADAMLAALAEEKKKKADE